MDKYDRGLFCVIVLFVVLLLPVWLWWLVIVLNLMFFRMKWLWLGGLILLVMARMYLLDNVELNRLNGLRGNITDWQVEVCGEPDVRIEFVNYTVCTENRGRILVKYGLFPRYKYGDKLIMSGILEDPFVTEEFSYRDYLKTKKIEAVLKKGKIFLIEEPEKFLFKRWLYDFKYTLFVKIEKSVPEPYSSLLLGLLFGAKKGFPEEITEAFKITGLTHVIAVSGYHVGLIMLLMNKLLMFIPRNIRFYLLTFGLVVFALLAGLSASVMRACVMGFLAMLTLQLGYSANILRSILLTAVAITFWNPAILFFDIGFQLSFYATLGIVYLAKIINFDFITEKFGLRESLVLTIAAQITTLPSSVYYFGSLSLISPVANLLITPFLPWLMLLGFLLLILGDLWGIGVFLRLITISLAEIFLWIIETLAQIPMARVILPDHNIAVLLVITVIILCLIIWLAFKYWKKEHKEGVKIVESV